MPGVSNNTSENLKQMKTSVPPMDKETDEKLRPQTKCTALLESSLSRMPGQLVLQLKRAAKILTDMALSERGTFRGQSYMGNIQFST